MKNSMKKKLMTAACLAMVLATVTTAGANDGAWLTARISVDTAGAEDLTVIEAAPVPMSEYFSIVVSDEPVYVTEIEIDADLQSHLNVLARFGDFESANYVISVFAAQEAYTK